MYHWTLEAALNSKVFSDVIVSSEDNKILLEIVNTRAIPFERSKELASDTATTFEVCKEVLQNIKSDSFALLLPTSPLRTAFDIENAHNKFEASKADCLMSISEFEYPPQWALQIYNNKLKGTCMVVTSEEDFYDGIKRQKVWIEEDYNKIENFENKRQDLTPLYKHDGSIIMCKTKAFLKANDWLDMKPVPWLTPKERSMDIDDLDSFEYAKYLLSRNSSTVRASAL